MDVEVVVPEEDMGDTIRDLPPMGPGRDARSAQMSRIHSSGTTRATSIMGSSRRGLALWQASLNAIEPAILNAISDESTSWYEPSMSRTRMSDRKSTRLNFSHVYFSYPVFFFFNDTATTEIYSLSLHDALPISFDPAFFNSISD